MLCVGMAPLMTRETRMMAKETSVEWYLCLTFELNALCFCGDSLCCKDSAGELG